MSALAKAGLNAATLRSLRLPIYVWGVIAGGLAVVIGGLVQLDGTPLTGDHPATFLAFAILLVATEFKPMPSLTDGTELTASWAFAFTLFFLGPTAGAIATVAGVALLADFRGSKRLDRSLFNAAQFALSLSAGGLAGSLVTDLLSVSRGETADLRWLAGVVVACTVGFAINSMFISVAIALHQGLPVLEMIRRSVGINLGMDGLLLALAPIFVVIGLEALVLVPLLLLTVWVIFKSAALALSNKHEATHDQLTNIPNRRMFEDHAALMLDNAENAKSQAAMIHIDLDGFKGVNDRLGHHYGDLVLQEVAERLDGAKRPADLVARLGGDEFAVLLGEINGRDDAEAVARRFLDAIEEPLDIEGVPLAVSASLGVSLYPRHGEDVSTLLHRADLAMYEAKEASGGVQVYSNDQESRMPGRLSLLSELSSAMEAGDLSLVYQPKVDLRTGQITGVEALLRWHHEDHGVVNPSWFMPQAEQTELMTPLTDHIMGVAMAQCEAWHAQGIRITVGVNVSARNLHDLRFPSRVGNLLSQHHLDPAWFEIEITENTVMADPVRSASVLGHLRALGVGISIDDFGTGYSSLASLRQLTIDRIKIDRSFVTDLATRDGDLTIARSVIELGHNLGLKAVAEGIETEEVLNILRDLECDEAQGFLISTPLPAAELTPLLLTGSIDLDALAPTDDPTLPPDAEPALAQPSAAGLPSAAGPAIEIDVSDTAERNER